MSKKNIKRQKRISTKSYKKLVGFKHALKCRFFRASDSVDSYQKGFVGILG